MEKEPQSLVFAYGSNLCTERMRSRATSAIPITIGYVSQRKLVFHKRSDDGSAKANATYTASQYDRVWGVVYKLHQHQKLVLDQHEFLGIGYDEEAVQVVHEYGVIQAWMYVARHDAIDDSLLPYSWYHELVIYGARQHGLPKHYIDHLRKFDSFVDPNSERHSANRQLMHG